MKEEVVCTILHSAQLCVPSDNNIGIQLISLSYTVCLWGQHIYTLSDQISAEAYV